MIDEKIIDSRVKEINEKGCCACKDRYSPCDRCVLRHKCNVKDKS